MNRPQCSGTLNAQTTQCTQSALCDATADADGSRSDGVQGAWETDGCDVVPLHGLQRHCTRAVDAWAWCKRSNHDRPRLAVGAATDVADTEALAQSHAAQRRGEYSQERRPIRQQWSGEWIAPTPRRLRHVRSTGRARRPAARSSISRSSWLQSPGHDSDRPIRPRVARTAGSRYTAVRRHNGPPRPRRRCSRQRPG